MNNEEYETKVKNSQDGLTVILDYIKSNTRKFDKHQTANLTKTLHGLYAQRDVLKEQLGKRYNNEPLDFQIEKYESLLKQNPSDYLAEIINKIRAKLRARRYTDYQISNLNRYLDPAAGKIASIGFPMIQTASPRQQRAGIQVLWNAVITNEYPPREAPAAIPATWALPWDDPRKTDQEGNPYHAPKDEEGYLIEGFDLSTLSQTEAAQNARKKLHERTLPHDYYGEPIELPPIKSQRALKEASKKRLELKEKQRAERKKHWEHQAKERRGE
jgi:hypothetical protein